MDNAEENAVELHGDEEIIEVIELNDTEPGPGMYQTTFESPLIVLPLLLERSGCFLKSELGRLTLSLCLHLLCLLIR